MDDEQRNLLRYRLRVAIARQPEIRDLRAILLEEGGVELVAPPWVDCDVPALIQAGIVMDWPVTLKLMERSTSHQNLARLWGSKRSGLIAIGTGYALTSDGLWRQHSWGVGRREIVETTLIRLTYFGYFLWDEDADAFALANG